MVHCQLSMVNEGWLCEVGEGVWERWDGNGRFHPTTWTIFVSYGQNGRYFYKRTKKPAEAGCNVNPTMNQASYIFTVA